MSKKFRSLVVTTGLVAALAAPAVASAEIRQGTATDPAGDSQAGPTRDITNVTARYDSNGQISGTVTLAAAPTADDPSFISFDFGSPTAPGVCGGVTAAMFGRSGGDPIVTVTGVRGTGSGTGVTMGNVVSFTSTQNAFRDRDWRCVTVGTRQFNAPAEAPNGDALTTPLYFDGFAPDGDGDGVPDPKDLCPTVAAPGTADGCPAPVAPPVAPPTVPSPPPAAAPALLSAGTVKRVKRGGTTALKLTLANPTTAALAKGTLTLKLPTGVAVKVGKRFKTRTATFPVAKLGAGKRTVLTLRLKTTKKAKKAATISATVARGKQTARIAIPLTLR